MADVGGRAEDRGLSTAVGYALNIAIAAILLTTLIAAAGGLVNDQRERVIDQELSIAGERLAGDLQAADRLAANAGTVRVTSKLPARAGGVDYRIEITDGDVELRSPGYDVSVTVPVQTDTSIVDAELGGGDVVIELDTDPDPNQLEVSDA